MKTLKMLDKFKVKTYYVNIFKIKAEADRKFYIAKVSESFNSFEEAHDYITNTLGGRPKFKASNIVKYNPDLYSNSYRMLISDKTGRVFFSYSKSDSRKMLKKGLAYFRKVAISYKNNKSSFYESYKFIVLHPAFWKLNGSIEKGGILFWSTDSGLEDIWHTVYRTSKGKVVHLIETGEYYSEEVTYMEKTVMLPARISTHDIRLDVVADTYEAAIIKLAKRVDKFYYYNGKRKN